MRNDARRHRSRERSARRTTAKAHQPLEDMNYADDREAP
jgi:hypothetical protein